VKQDYTQESRRKGKMKKLKHEMESFRSDVEGYNESVPEFLEVEG
jgi:hypothetical protein